MPKVDVSRTGISPANVKPFIAPGVEDHSAAIGIKTQTGLLESVGRMGIDAYKGYQLADVEKEQEGVIQEYMDRRDPRMLLAETGKMRENIDSNIWNNLDTTIEEVNPIEKKFQSTLAKYKSAVDQGVMSSEEFNNRTLTVLRDAVNRNPGMLKELSDHAQTVLELSGIQGIIKQDKSVAEKQQKSQDELEAYYRSIAKEANISLTFNSSGTVDYTKLRTDVAIYQGEKALLSAADRQSQFDENHFKNFGTQYATGKINEGTDLAIKIINDPSMSYDKAILQTNLILDSVEKGFTSDPRVGKIIDKPSVAATRTYLKDQISAIKSNLKAFASKEDAATYLKNATNMLRDQQYQDVSKVVNPQMLDILSKLTTSVGVADFISKQPELKVNMYNSISRVLDGLPTNSINLYSGAKSPMVDIINTLSKEVGTKDPSSSSLTAISNSIKTIDADTKTMAMPEKFGFYTNYVKVLGNPSNKGGLAKLDDGARFAAASHVNEYANVTLTNMKEVLDKATGKVTIGVLPDGRLNITAEDPALQKELNSKFIPRINDSILAISNLNGHGTTKEAAKEFYNIHKQYFVGGK